MNPLYAIVPAYLQDADLVIEKEGGITFVCKVAPFAKHGEDLMNQNCWQIKRIRVYANEQGSCTEIMFPNGSQKFDFCIAEMEQYTYAFKR